MSHYSEALTFIEIWSRYLLSKGYKMVGLGEIYSAEHDQIDVKVLDSGFAIGANFFKDEETHISINFILSGLKCPILERFECYSTARKYTIIDSKGLYYPKQWTKAFEFNSSDEFKRYNRYRHLGDLGRSSKYECDLNNHNVEERVVNIDFKRVIFNDANRNNANRVDLIIDRRFTEFNINNK